MLFISKIGFLSLCGFVFFTHVPVAYILPFFFQYEPVEKCAIIALFCAAIEFAFNRAKYRVISTELYLLVFLLLCCIILTTYSMDVTNSKEFLWGYLAKSIASFFLIVILANSMKRIKILGFVFTVGALYIGYYIFLAFESGWRYAGRAYGKFIGIATDPNDIALIMIYTMPLSLGLSFLVDGKLKKLFFLLAAAVMYFALLRTYSRGGFLGFVTTGIILFFSFYRKTPAKKKILFLGCASAFLMLATRYMPQSYIWRMQEIFLVETDSTHSAQIRAFDMTTGFEYMVKHPISYVGIGNSGLILRDLTFDPNRYKEKKTVTGDTYIVDTQYSPIHSFIIQAGVELGWLPCLIILYFLFSLQRKFRKFTLLLRKEEGHTFSKNQKFLSCLVSSWYGFLVAAFFLPVWYRFYFFYVSGICLSFLQVIENRLNEHTTNLQE